MFVINSECTKGMRETIADNSIDAIVTDPPYGLSKEPDMSEVLKHWLNGDDYNHTGSGFMGKKWDSFVPGPSIWREAFRCLKPGGYALVFAGSRTQDLMTTALRLAGFEIRDVAMWIYGSGFPKSLNVGNGYGTALKPAYEPIIIARKPLAGTVANNIEQYGTGAINIDGCRIPNESDLGRWPANIMHDGSDEVIELFPDTKSGGAPKPGTPRTQANTYNEPTISNTPSRGSTSGSAARYFYCAKTSKTDRNAGLDDFEHISASDCVNRDENSAGIDNPRAGAGRTSGAKNNHPTVKPTELMRWCCRLVGHPNALIMDPFAGSGSTGRGAALERFAFIGFEMDENYCNIANARISDAYLQSYVDEGDNIA